MVTEQPDLLMAVDIGNTSVHLGVFRSEELVASYRLAANANRLTDEYAIIILSLLRNGGVSPEQISDCVLGSTVPPLTQTFEELARRYFGIQPLVVGSGVRTGVRILYDSPRDVGPDRIIDAVAAIRLYGPPVIVVDFGTATVFDAVSREGDYLGGAIAPGIGIAANALFEHAAMLYRIELERPRCAIGKNTVHAMQSGIMFGYVGLVEGIVDRFQRELGGNATVVATGGYASLIARETPAIQQVEPNLTLTGLRIIYDLNRGPHAER